MIDCESICIDKYTLVIDKVRNLTLFYSIFIDYAE